VLVILAGFLLMLAGRRLRKWFGLGGGRTVSLTSRRLGLTGRPDRLVKADGSIVIGEWESARTVRQCHRAQMGVYFLLVEAELKMRPPHGSQEALPNRERPEAAAGNPSR
jgi:hypothetical protein